MKRAPSFRRTTAAQLAEMRERLERGERRIEISRVMGMTHSRVGRATYPCVADKRTTGARHHDDAVPLAQPSTSRTDPQRAANYPEAQ